MEFGRFKRMSKPFPGSIRSGLLCRLGFHRGVLHHGYKGIFGDWSCPICWYRHEASTWSKKKWIRWMTNDLIVLFQRGVLCRLGRHEGIITYDDKGLIAGAWYCSICQYSHKAKVLNSHLPNVNNNH